jgi:hypothetical protein
VSRYREATRLDAEEFAATLKKSHLICRSYGHNKFPHTVSIVTLEGSRKRYYEQTLRCRNRCGVKWRILIDMTTGLQLYYHSDYSEATGYLAKGIGRITADGRGAMRLRYITEKFTEESEENGD